MVKGGLPTLQPVAPEPANASDVGVVVLHGYPSVRWQTLRAEAIAE